MTHNSSDYQKIWDVLYLLIESTKTNDKLISKIIQQTDKQKDMYDKLYQQMKKTDQQMKETDKKMKETDKRINKLKDIVGGIGNSNGYVAEDIFYNSFAKHMSIGNITFDYIDRNMERTHKGLKDEFDIVLTNSNCLVIVEIKYNFHHNDVKNVLNKINNFRLLFPMYKTFKIFGAIAALTMSKKTIKAAKEFGFFVLTLEGKKLKVINDDVMVYSKDD